jgi:hypothetical protein
MPPSRRQPASVSSLLIRRRFPPARRQRAERDWIFLLLEELNGLGDVVRFKRAEDPEAAVVDELTRARALLKALGWQAKVAVGHTWEFVQTRLRFPEDAWGPNLLLERLDPGPRLSAWRADLPEAARTVLERTPKP